MSETSETSLARRRIRRISGLRSLSTMVVGAAFGLAVLSAVRLFSGQPDVFPVVLVSVLVIVGVIGEVATRRSYEEALDDLELASSNDGRRAVLDPAR